MEQGDKERMQDYYRAAPYEPGPRHTKTAAFLASLDGKRGSLEIAQDLIKWTSIEGDQTKVKIPIENLKGLRKNNISEEEPRALVQVELIKGPPLIFNFIGPSPLGERKEFLSSARHFISDFKNRSQILIPPSASKPQPQQSSSPQSEQRLRSSSQSSPPKPQPSTVQPNPTQPVPNHHYAHPMTTADIDEIIEVRVLSHLDAGEHVVYFIRARCILKQNRGESEITAYHRFNDFWTLNSNISRLYQRKDLPDFPPKTWLQTHKDKAVCDDRCTQLDIYFQKIVQNKLLMKNPMIFTLVANFLFASEDVDGRKPTGDITYTRAALEKGAYYINQYLTTGGREPTPTEDYEDLLQRLKRWDKTPTYYPWRKFVVNIFGTTSAGKSSLVNHLFTLVCTRSGTGQVDTGYTIVETLPEEEFALLTSVRSFEHMSDEELLAPLPVNTEIISDRRHGKVFVYNYEPLQRYHVQFHEYANLINTYKKLRAIYINERYLRGAPSDIDLAKKIIVIDSKGLDQQVTNEILDIKRDDKEISPIITEIQIMQLFNKVSDLTLFLLPHGEINNCANQLALFELSVICAIDGTKFIYDQMKAIKERDRPVEKGLIYGMISSLIDQPIELARSWLAPAPGKKTEKSVVGNERWAQTRFIITKIDELYHNTTDFHSEELQLYYTLGRSFARSLKYLEAPTMSQIGTIGVPEKQQSTTKPFTGGLGSLKSYLLNSAREENSYLKKLDKAIDLMCSQLEEACADSAVYNQLWSRDQYYVEQIRTRLRKRSALGNIHNVQ